MDWPKAKAQLNENKLSMDQVVDFSENASIGMKFKVDALRIAETSSKLSELIDFADRVDTENRMMRADDTIQQEKL